MNRPRALLLTHVHLDHAGATGSLAGAGPSSIYVHELGARHMVDPTGCWQRPARLYGGRAWIACGARCCPCPSVNLQVLDRRRTALRAVAFEVAYTPGHARTTSAYRHERTAFVGDVGGVGLSPSVARIPPAPPPDIDVEVLAQVDHPDPVVAALTARDDPFWLWRRRRGAPRGALERRLDEWAERGARG